LSLSKKKRKKRKPRKGFTRSRKEWEESLATHIGKVVDNLSGKDLADLALVGGLAYLGYYHLKNPVGLLYGPVCLKLATSMNSTAGIAGTLGLVSLGLPFVFSGLAGTTPTRKTDTIDKYREEHGGEEPSEASLTFDPQFSECPEGYFLTRDSFGEVICMPKNPFG